MKTLTLLFSTVLGIVLLGALAAGGYWGITFVASRFSELEPQAAVLTTIASMTAVLCAALVFRGLAQVSQKEIKTQMRLEKANLYERILLLWDTKLRGRPAGVDPSVEDELQQLAQLLTLRGSPKVIKTYCELYALERASGLYSPDLPARLVTVQMEMRKDLGLPTQDLKAEDFLQFFSAEVKAAPDLNKAQPRQDIQPRVSLAAGA